MAKWFRKGDTGPEAEPEPWWHVDESPAASEDASSEPDASDHAEAPEALDTSEDEVVVEPAGEAEPTPEEPVSGALEESAAAEAQTPEPPAAQEEPVAGEAATGAAAASGGFMAGLSGRFKRKKGQPAEAEPVAPVGGSQPADEPVVEVEPQAPDQPAAAEEPLAAEEPSAAERSAVADEHVAEPTAPTESEPEPGVAAAAVAAGAVVAAEAGAEFPAEPTPTIQMPESRPGLFGGLKSRFRRSKEPVESAPPAVPEVGETTADEQVGTETGPATEPALAEEPTSTEAAAQAEPTLGAVEDTQPTEVLPAAGTEGVLIEGQKALPPAEPVFVAPAPPPPATLIAGSSLVAVVSRGPDPTAPPLSMIPNVTGLPQEEALDGLQELGVAAQIVLAYSSDAKVGRVIAQYPTPGTPFPETQSAVLVVSRGPAAVPHVVVLPNLTGMFEDDATREIKQLGLEPFTVDAHDPEIPAGTVLNQVPSPDSLAVAPVERRALWPWLLGAALIVLLTFGAFLLWRLNATYPVPSVVGQTQLTAQQTIEDAGFSVGSVISSPVAGVPRGAVASQIPTANAQAKLRSLVSLVVSSGEPLVAIPNVVGKSESEATTDLANVDLTTEVIRAYDATVPAGNVVSQFPIAGDQVLPNTVIGLVVSRGRPPSIGATVPSVTGLTQSKATSAVSKAKLTSQVFTVPSASVKSGVVVGQLPPPGSLVAKSSQVYLFVSRGRVSSTTTLTASVPNLIGQTQIQAITNINSAGLIAVVSQAYSSAIPPGIVYAQVPQPGAVVSRETQVGIIVSQGPAPLQ